MGFNLAPFILFPFSLILINALSVHTLHEGEHLSALTKRGSRWNSSILLTSLNTCNSFKMQKSRVYFGLYYI